MPFCSNFRSRPICQTLSNAIETYKKLPRVSQPSSREWQMLWVIEKSWLTQESLCLKPDWFGDIKFLSEKMSTCYCKWGGIQIFGVHNLDGQNKYPP